MTALEEVLAAERSRPPVGEVRPILVSRQRADVSDLLWPVIPRSVPEADPTADVLRMAGCGWTARQIGALLRLDTTAVVRILAHHGRGPAAVPDLTIEGGLAA